MYEWEGKVLPRTREEEHHTVQCWHLQRVQLKVVHFASE